MEFKASDIAAFLNGEIEGDGKVKVNNVSKIEEGEPGTLAFLANPKYETYLYTTEASVVLINRNLELKQKVSATLIKVDDAYQAFAALLDLYLQAKSNLKVGIEQPSFMDASVAAGKDIYLGAFAYVSKNVIIGNNVKIYPQCFIGENVTIGEGSVLFPGVKIYDNCVVGNNCIVHAGAVIGSDGFGFAPKKDGSYKKIAQIGNVILEDDVEIGANTTIDCGTMGSTIIRKGAKLDNLIQIAHNCEVGDNSVLAAQVGVAGTTKIGKNCKFGGQVGLNGHITIGDNVQLAGQTGVSNNVKDGEILLGTPAIDFKLALRASIAFKNLPQMVKDVAWLQKEVEEIKSKK